MSNYHIKHLEEYFQVYRKSVRDPESFWEEIAEEHFIWRKKWDRVLQWDFQKPEVTWFEGARLNITENCLDRHLPRRAGKTALLFEPNDPDGEAAHITYQELYERVCKMANVLKAQGVGKGDRVCIYLPMIPELAVAVLACARIGAIHSVVFAGFSSSALATRINDCDCQMVITSDGSFRGAKTIDLKGIVDAALKECPGVENVLVVKRTGGEVQMEEGRDLWLAPLLEKASPTCPVEIMGAEDPLFILYTSGSTGKPKGMVHTCGGYMVYTAYTFKNIFQYREEDVYWCTADIGWITGHSYIVYGPLANGATTLMFEGVPSYPDFGRFWEVVEKHRVNQFWHWYNNNVGKGKSPIVDTWWQTETGGIMISPIPFVTPTTPTFATLPFIGVQPALMDEDGKEIRDNQVSGRLCIKFPWPSMARTIWGDHKRYRQTYFSTFENKYFTGDGAMRDAVGYYRITGRVDDVIIVSGHNLGTAPIEDSINEHPAVAESAIVGFPHDIKGNALYGFMILKETGEGRDRDNLRREINQQITEQIGPIAKLEKIQFVPGLPKTRSGKIMRRILRKIACKDTSNLGDISTLLNPEVVQEIMDNAL
ncbi:MAG: acetate--CoA ligase [Robiginitalea sp.]